MEGGQDLAGTRGDGAERASQDTHLRAGWSGQEHKQQQWCMGFYFMVAARG